MNNSEVPQAESSGVVHRIDFEPLGRRGECPAGETLLTCASRLGLGLSSVCGGQGKCRSCRLQLLGGTASVPARSEHDAFSPEELREGWRLACQTYPSSDCRVRVPSESMTSPQRVAIEGMEIDFEADPVVRGYQLELPPSSPQPFGDADRLLTALNRHLSNCRQIDIGVLQVLSHNIRAWNWQFQALVRDDEMVALLPRNSRPLGLAIDLGTTKIAGYLLDLTSGETLAAAGTMNPQISYGEDVISRIGGVIGSPELATELQKAALEAINQLTSAMCSRTNNDAANVVEATVVGNTAMHHILLHLPVDQLAKAPYIPVVTSPLDIKARDIGLDIGPGAYVHMLPNIAGFIGSDHVAMLLSTATAESEGPLIAMDIGTNTEVSLVKHGEITAVSCASGPAFEGGHIRDGMRAAPGAIERVWIEEEAVRYETIDNLPPIGICGSGILDALAQLYSAGVVDHRGRMNDGHSRIRQIGNQREFVLVDEDEGAGKPPIVITQHDIRELQLAKAAIRTGIQVLLETNLCTDDELVQIVIAGAFGTYINVASAVAIGLLPPLPYGRFRQVGNAAGMGAKLALASRTKRIQARSIASRVSYLELGGAPGFSRNFLLASYLGRYKIVDGKRQATGDAE